LAIEPPFKSPIIQIIGQWPAQSGIAGQLQVFGDDAFGYAERPSDGVKAQVSAVA
jgi:hypothetical protein